MNTACLSTMVKFSYFAEFGLLLQYLDMLSSLPGTPPNTTLNEKHYTISSVQFPTQTQTSVSFMYAV